MNAWTTWVALLEGTDNVLLPAANQVHFVVHGGWAVVLAWFVYWGVTRFCHWAFRAQAQRNVRRWATALAMLVGALTLLSGEVSPAFWLGLAFQSPSLMAVTCCAYFLVKQTWVTGLRSMWAEPSQPAPWSLYWLVSGALCGAV
ncbi:MAG: hypothetical protein ACOVOD_17715, partial [Rhodoferax sp.]